MSAAGRERPGCGRPPTARLFDRYVIVDWSAASSPARGRDSIWSASLEAATGVIDGPHNHPTRADAFDHLVDLLVAHPDDRVLVGLDLAYAYPQGTAAAWGAEPSWRGVWSTLSELVQDDHRNRNNRFAVASELNRRVSAGPGPFWGCPAARATEHLSPRKQPGFPHRARGRRLSELRLTEQVLRAAGRRVFSVWQTSYAGSVGGQTLMGVPWLDRLVRHPQLAGRTEVWPFTTGLGPDPAAGRDAAIVHAEIWPGIVEVDLGLHPVRDACQVLQLCRLLAQRDATGQLGEWFAPALDPADAHVVVTEEGWILGATVG